MHATGSSQFSSTPCVGVGFRPVFFQPDWLKTHHSGDASEQNADVSPGGTSCDTTDPSALDSATPAKRTRISFNESHHGTHEAFCLSEDFTLLEQQFRENLDFLVAFCRDNGVTDADKFADCFAIFFKRRFDKASYVHYGLGYAPLIDSRGKQSLDNFCDMIRDPGIPLSKKIPAIRNLSEGVDKCGPGALSALITADIDLSMSVGGIRAALWKAKEDTVRAVLLREVQAKFGSKNQGMEVHRVNCAWNYLAGPIGLRRSPDDVVSVMDDAFLERCLETVSAELTPNRLARMLAEQCLAIFNSALVVEKTKPHGKCTMERYDTLLKAFQAVLDELQLGKDALCLHSFVFIDPSGDSYRLRGDSSLVARDVLGIMNADQLLAGAPRNWGVWPNENGAQYALFTFGEDIAWRAERQNASSQWPGLDKSSDVEAVSVSDLAAWQRRRGLDDAAPPIAAMWYPLLHCSDSKDVLDLPDEYLNECLLATLRTKLNSLSGEDLEHWLEDNLLDTLKKVSKADRARFFDEALGTNMAENDADIIDILLGVNDGKQNPQSTARARSYSIFHSGASLDRLHKAMETGDAKAVAVWHRLIVGTTLFDQAKPHLLKLLGGLRRYDNSPGFCLALQNGHAEAIVAFHALLKDPALLPHISHVFPELLTARRRSGTPGLCLALQNGHAAAITAFHALVKDPNILPHVSHILPELLRAERYDGWPGLHLAMHFDRTDAIGAFHKLLADPDVLPIIRHKLPRLLTGKSKKWRFSSYLSIALGRGGDVKSMATFHALLKDPAILPHIKHVLPKLLAARRLDGKSVLMRAAKASHSNVIREFHRTLSSPEIVPHLGDTLTELLPIKDLLYILQKGNPQIIVALHALLGDPKIKPHAEKIMPDVFRIRLSPAPDGLVELAQALQAGEAKAILKFSPFTTTAWYHRIFRKDPLRGSVMRTI